MCRPQATNFAGLLSELVSPPIYSVLTSPVQIADGSSPFALWVGSPEVRARIVALYPSLPTVPQPHAPNYFGLHWTPLRSSLSVSDPAVQYEYAVGTSLRGHQLRSWTLIANPRVSAFNVELLSPVAGGTTLFIEMRARGCSGLVALAHSTVVVDVSAPAIDSMLVHGTQISGAAVLSLTELQRFTCTVHMHDQESPMHAVEWSAHNRGNSHV